jgi:protein O-GlcNAc transferase
VLGWDKEATDRLIAEGNRAETAGAFPQACELYRRAVASAPRYGKAHLNLGIGLEALGDIPGALACYESALALDAADPFAAYNLGKLLYARGELPRARQLLEQALRQRPEFPEARIVLAYALQAQGELAAAATQLQTALPQRPEDFVARAALFHILEAQGDLAAAAAQLEGVLRDRPDWTEALYNYGRMLMRLERDAEAETALRRVLVLDPGFVLAYRMLGNLLHRQGRVAEMLELCAGALGRNRDQLEIASFELFLLNFSDAIAAEALFERHRAFGERLERARPPAFAFRRAADAERRLRIGYVSGDLNSHPVALFLLPVLERHDRARFEVCCYSTGTRADDFTRRVAAHCDVWRDAAASSETQLAQAIHADAVDILIDLSGHSGVSRLGVFALQPAPVQAAWLGYLNTTGLTRIHYRITDAVSDPPAAERLHTETLERLPHTQWCYRPFVQTPAAAPPPCLRDGRVTFGSFTQIAKLSSATLALWGAIFRQLPDARLAVLGVAAGRASTEVRERLAGVGIGASRVTLVPFAPLREYYDWFAKVDIALDTTPYSGGTTTCDALWMGVPVVSLPGPRPPSRSAASILTTLGLADWIASSPEDYVRRAVGAAGNRERLADLRSTLRSRMQASPLMDEVGFTRDLEQLYRRIWRQYCNQR